MSDREILEIFLEIGFHKVNTGIGIGGETQEFKYYLDKNHYTLVVFRSNKYTKKPNGSSFRLYLHRDIDGSYVSSPFQIDTYCDYNIEQLIIEINKIFKSELREIKLNQIL